MSVTHQFVSTIPDDADASLVRPSNWNDTHDLGGESLVPVGGTTGQVLAKTSNADGDTGWAASAGTQSLAQTLAIGNDTGGLAIVNTTTGATNAVVDSTATSVDGTASAKSTATAQGSGSASSDITAQSEAGSAFAKQTADASQSAGAGDAAVTASAFAFSGNADASRTAAVSSGSANATALTVAQSDTGTADATVAAGSSFGSASIGPVADATSALIMVTGLPTSDPAVAGALYQLSGVLMVSNG